MFPEHSPSHFCYLRAEQLVPTSSLDSHILGNRMSPNTEQHWQDYAENLLLMASHSFNAKVEFNCLSIMFCVFPIFFPSQISSCHWSKLIHASHMLYSINSYQKYVTNFIWFNCVIWLSCLKCYWFNSKSILNYTFPLSLLLEQWWLLGTFCLHLVCISAYILLIKS